jgi:predicted acetyltransferase
MPLIEPVYQAAVDVRPGMLSRDERWQRRAISDPVAHRKDKSTLRCVVAEDADGVRGYARYATAMAWQGSGPEGVVHVREMQALDPAAYAAVWRFLSDLDLTTSVSTRNRPVDDPLLDLLTNVRAANPALSDGLYVRLVDVDRALADRTYADPLDLVLEVTDELCPWNAGRWRLSADGSGATCGRTTDPAELRLSTTELGAAYLGGGSLTSLAGAGRVDEVRRGALAAAARAFTHDLQPCCPFVF